MNMTFDQEHKAKLKLVQDLQIEIVRFIINKRDLLPKENIRTLSGVLETSNNLILSSLHSLDETEQQRSLNTLDHAYSNLSSYKYQLEESFNSEYC